MTPDDSANATKSSFIENSESSDSDFLSPGDGTRNEPAAADESLSAPQGCDYVVRGITADGNVRAFAATTRRTVQAARDAHQTSPVVTAALGRLLTAGAMMGSMMKDPDELITLQVKGDGPIGSLTVTADSQGHVKGYADNPEVWLPLNDAGHLDVGKAVGAGSLSVVQDVPWGEPYTSQIELATGEIGDDIAAYYAESEQTASSVGLGVLVDTDLSVRQAGGFIIQLMPDCPDDIVDRIEKNVRGMRGITDALEDGVEPLGILQQALAGLDFQPLEYSQTAFSCNCSRERTERVLIALGADELQSLIDDHKPAELVCSFCGARYTFSEDELVRLLAEAKSPKSARDA
jgi:molecular chaperone Hsp33